MRACACACACACARACACAFVCACACACACVYVYVHVHVHVHVRVCCAPVRVGGVGCVVSVYSTAVYAYVCIAQLVFLCISLFPPHPPLN